MTDVSQAFVDKSRSLLVSDYLPKIETCLDRLSEHFGMHTGQIILLSKARTGEDMKLWRPNQ